MTSIKRYRKQLIFVVLLLVIGSYATYAFTKPLPALLPSVTKLPSKAAQVITLPWPGYGEAAVGAVGYGVLASSSSQTAIPTASTIKILTALAVLKQKPLTLNDDGPAITITQADVDSYNKYVSENGSVVNVQVGEQISEYQALQAMLLPSANNMAETLARWAYGSLDAYNTAANQFAKQLGMSNTTVTDPSGFLPSTVSSAYDLTLLGEAALQNPVIAQIVAQTSANIPVQGTVHNVNQLLGENSIVGIKTGNNDQDSGVFLFGATHDVSGKTVTIVGAVMNAPDLGTVMHDSLPIITSAGGDFTVANVAHAGEVVGHYSLPWSKPIDVVVSKDVALLTWKGTAVTSSLNLQKLQAPVSTTKSAGNLTVQNSLDNSKTSVPVKLKQAITKPSWTWRLEHAF